MEQARKLSPESGALAPPQTACAERRRPMICLGCSELNTLKGDAMPVERIAIADLAKKLENDAVTLVDVRDRNELASGVIPGSKHIPMNQLERRLNELSKESEIVLY
jgi:hypothetical protein